ncbi:MAG TPA: 30S ribosomal protein S1 [Thermomicrobiales bacterium]|nr:30S ribosomal protein S1 [Thermomicrobiales bacterium]
MDRSDFDGAPGRMQGGVGFDDDGADSVGRSLMEQLLADPTHDYRTLKYGDVIDGTIMHVDRDEILVDIGSKSEGVIPAREFSSLNDDERDALDVGHALLVFVVQPENQDGHAVVSIDRARQEKSWRVLQEQFEASQVIDAEVVNYNKGGLLVNLDGVRGFVPASQVTEIRGGDDAQKQADMARLIGSKLQLKIIEINRHRNRLILSERQALQERRDEMKEKLIEQLREGEVRTGRVSSICDFGAFVDVGGADGLVHLSELSWSRVRHPSEVLTIGQEIDVFVLGINADEKKIALSIKRTQAEPWSRVAANYDVNQLVTGVVTQLANFGAFARIEDGIEGLVHVSELSDARISHPRQLVSEGQELLLRIIRIDPQRRRMGLSLRRALEATDEEVEEAIGAEAVALKAHLLAMEVEPDPDAEESFDVESFEPATDDVATPEVVEAAVEQEPAATAMSEAFAAADTTDDVATADTIMVDPATTVEAETTDATAAATKGDEAAANAESVARAEEPAATGLADEQPAPITEVGVEAAESPSITEAVKATSPISDANAEVDASASSIDEDAIDAGSAAESIEPVADISSDVIEASPEDLDGDHAATTEARVEEPAQGEADEADAAASTKAASPRKRAKTAS